MKKETPAMHRSSLDLQTLRIFLEISRDCNMSRAAESLGLTQSAVS
jgi:DNA-binding transcriptional LysR family regulator